jgi:hypothetical protein
MAPFNTANACGVSQGVTPSVPRRQIFARLYPPFNCQTLARVIGDGHGDGPYGTEVVIEADERGVQTLCLYGQVWE